MNYKQAVDYINSFLVFGSKLGLERISNLLDRLGNPQNELKFIHVAGTNGKGSICAYSENILRAAGFKTGLFISPYIVDFRERFQVNGQMILKRELCEIVEQIKDIVDTLSPDEIPTEFEIITAIGYVYFAQNKCDVVLLEVGLGGRFDATNTIDTPLCSVISSISLDHTAILGDTLEKIAFEKAGIIKPNGITILYPQQEECVTELIKKICKERNNTLYIPEKDYLITNTSIYGDAIHYGNYDFTLPLLGECQPLNAITAIATVKECGLGVCGSSILYGIENTRFPARCEVVSKNPLIIVDGAHNPDGVKSLKTVIQKYMDNPNAVIGMMKDKDIDNVLNQIAPLFNNIFTVTVDNPRSISAKDLAKKAKKYCGNVYPCDSIRQAIENATKDGQCCICGSFYLCSQAEEFL